MQKYISFGSWRFFLAFLVVISHLWVGMIHGPAAYAVWGFYVLSGYLMTKILRDKYGFNRKGILSYAHNRFLRIMPLYYIAFFIGIITIVVLAKDFDLHKVNGQFGIPNSIENWIFSLTLIPLFQVGNIPVPVANALGIEVGAYILIPLLAKYRSNAWIVAIIALILNWNYGFTLESFGTRYATFLPCLLPFAIGSLLAHYKDKLSKLSFPALSLAAWCLHCLLWLKYPYWPWTHGLLVSTFLSAWVTISLDTNKTSVVDKKLGDLSYPIYLLHTTVAAWFIPYFGYGGTKFSFFLVSFFATIIISIALVMFIDRPLNKIKKPVVNQPTLISQ